MSSRNEDPFFSNLPVFYISTFLEGCGTEAVQFNGNELVLCSARRVL